MAAVSVSQLRGIVRRLEREVAGREPDWGLVRGEADKLTVLLATLERGHVQEAS